MMYGDAEYVECSFTDAQYKGPLLNPTDMHQASYKLRMLGWTRVELGKRNTIPDARQDCIDRFLRTFGHGEGL